MIKQRYRVFMCGISWQHEVDAASSGVKIYPSVDSIKKYDPCTNSGCGIVECEITFKRWVKKQDLKKMMETSTPANLVNRKMIKEVKKQIKTKQKFLKKLQKENKKCQ